MPTPWNANSCGVGSMPGQSSVGVNGSMSATTVHANVSPATIVGGSGGSTTTLCSNAGHWQSSSVGPPLSTAPSSALVVGSPGVASQIDASVSASSAAFSPVAPAPVPASSSSSGISPIPIVAGAQPIARSRDNQEE